MQFEKFLKNLGEPYSLKPIPRYISAGCGICVEFSWDIASDGTIPDLAQLYKKEDATYVLLI
jgi:hypothetical protein